MEVPPFPLGVRWKFRPFARLPKQRVHSVIEIVVEIGLVEICADYPGLVLKLNEFKKK